MASLLKRGNTYWLQYRFRGKLYRVSLKTKDKAMAEHYLQEHERKVALGYVPVQYAPPNLSQITANPNPLDSELAFQDFLRSDEGREWMKQQTPPPVPYHEVEALAHEAGQDPLEYAEERGLNVDFTEPPLKLKTYLTEYFHYVEHIKQVKPRSLEAKRTALKSFAGFCKGKGLGVKYLDDITPGVVFQYKEYGIKQYSKRTVLSYFTELASVWEWGVKKGTLSDNPFKTYKPKNPKETRKRFLSEDEIRRLLRALPKFHLNLQKAVHIALYTGMRYSEIVALKWEWIVWRGRENSFIDLPVEDDYSPKGNRGRKVPIIPLLYEFLSTKKQATGYVIESVRKTEGKNRIRVDLKNSFKKLLAEANIENFRFHDFRRTYFSYGVQLGISSFMLAEYGGHTEIELIKVYGALMENNPEMQKFEQKFRAILESEDAANQG